MHASMTEMSTKFMTSKLQVSEYKEIGMYRNELIIHREDELDLA